MSGALAVEMSDFSPAGALPVRRPLGKRRNGDGDGEVDPLLPVPELAPAPKPWKGAPIVAALICVAFLMLQMLPATHYRHPADPTRTWIPIRQEQDQGESGKEVEEVDAREFVTGIKSTSIDLFVCTDEKDLRPLVVVINSTLANTRHTQRIRFHIITTESQREAWLSKLKALFPLAAIDMVSFLDIVLFHGSEKIDFEEISNHVFYRKDSKAREALTSPYNFLPFYLPRMFPGMQRIIYLDSDVVGDIEELFNTDLEDHPVAAVEDCSQIFGSYFNFDLLHRIQSREASESTPWIPRQPFDPTACIFNRGVLVIDPRKWIEHNSTEAIEWWLDEFHQAQKPLYKYGVSQPPFLLALYNHYKKLDTAWNTRGLGRAEFSEAERDYMKKLYSKRPPRRPFVSPNTEHSKILHFNGRFKPWNRDSSVEQPPSLCGSRSEDCARLWWAYISPNGLFAMNYQALLEVLWSTLPRPKYATGGEVDATKFAMPTFMQVEGAGDLPLPLSNDGFLKLKAVSQQAPYGKGEETLLDTDVRRAWQVEASKVSCPQIPDFFSKVVLDMAVPAMEELGIDAGALGLDVRLYKLLLYEQGGHFEFHRDTEKEDGMFATMILQLPTQSGHEGGQLEIRQGKKNSVSLGFSGAASRSGYFQMAFFCDCEHRLAEVTSGTRLCLVFSLVRSNTKFIDVDARKLPHYVSAVGSVQSQMKEWAEETRRVTSPILAIPLGHQYSNNSLSFAGLKGHDRVVGALVLSCASFLDVHLCMLVKHSTGYDTDYGRCEDHRYSLENWTTPDDQKPELDTADDFPLAQVLRYEKSEDDPFGESPDEEDYEPYQGNEGGNTHSFYHTAALVVWPKESRMVALCNTQSIKAVRNWLEEQHKREPGRTRGDLERYLAALTRTIGSRTVAWIRSKWSFESLLQFCLEHDFRDAAFLVMKNFMVIKTWNFLPRAAQDVVAAVQKYGWDELYSQVIARFLEDGTLSWRFGASRLVECLRESGFQDEGVSLAKKLLAKGGVSDVKRFSPFSVEDELEDEKSFLSFFVECGLEDETWKIVSMASGDSKFSANDLVQVVKKWGASSVPRIDEFWEKRLKIKEASWEETSSSNSWQTRSPKEELRREGWIDFLGDFAMFTVELEAQGCHDAAVTFASKRYVKVASLEEVYGKILFSIENQDALAMLLALDKKTEQTEDMVAAMKKAARLIGLKKDEKVTQLFSDLLSQALEASAANEDNRYKELYEAVIWLGPAETVKSVAKRVRSGSLVLLDDEKEDSSLIERAKEWDDGERDGLKEVIKARIHYLSADEDEKDRNAAEKRRSSLNPRIKRVRYDEKLEVSPTEIERLRKLLSDLP
ncbi:hypothetical protein SELMODRAFT_437525 [Selaginella moellendorffii]|uniref:Fe2OG dioxygenase domain-containing protein n=1 Tax=Selaginella moellendorffii TaxID=88036 RepID=D8QMS1_SELML|nr:hypothetical protein SELMODRAFT_437525 [Selaginella moellendorffii]